MVCKALTPPVTQQLGSPLDSAPSPVPSDKDDSGQTQTVPPCQPAIGSRALLTEQPGLRGAGTRTINDCQRDETECLGRHIGSLVCCYCLPRIRSRTQQ